MTVSIDQRQSGGRERLTESGGLNMAKNEPKCIFEDGCPGLSDEAVEYVEDGGGCWYEWLCDRCRADHDEEFNSNGDDGYPDDDDDDDDS